MKKFQNKKTKEIFIVNTPSLISQYEKDSHYTEIKKTKEEKPRPQEENTENK